LKFIFLKSLHTYHTYRQAGNAAQDGEAQLFLSATLAQTFNIRFSALTGAAITEIALAEPFIAAGAAVAFIRCSLLFFKGPHGLVVPSRLGPFLLQKKVKPPRL
jgi:hypothetical protein